MTIRAIVSDQHFHAWSAFSTATVEGKNSRLEIAVGELRRAAKTLKEFGGGEMIFAGDLFHVRGSIDPEVFNVVHEAVQEILNDGIVITAIPGNHDLKGKETSELGNAMQTFGALKNFQVVTTAQAIDDVFYVPWCSTPDLLRAKIKEIIDAYTDLDEMDLVIHAPINGVIEGLPDHGLTSAEVAAWGFRRVFCGHYHNFKTMEEGKVVSIGALCQQTWSDVGSKAGFLIVNEPNWLIGENGVSRFASHAPSFVDIDETTDEEDIPLIVDQNYVRVRGLSMNDAEIKLFKEGLVEMGAAGTSFQIARQTVSARTGTPVVALSLEQSLAKYITTMSIADASKEAAVQAACNDILSAVSSVAV